MFETGLRILHTKKKKMRSYLALTVNILHDEKRKKVDGQYPLVCIHENFWEIFVPQGIHLGHSLQFAMIQNKLFQNKLYFSIFIIHNFFFALLPPIFLPLKSISLILFHCKKNIPCRKKNTYCDESIVRIRISINERILNSVLKKSVSYTRQ